ncbi:MAG: hypothetical protein KGL39_13715 [Patescibacteria group bacterium]|nr:hypothetical protein [Patescibacteria group bacterium]
MTKVVRFCDRCGQCIKGKFTVFDIRSTEPPDKPVSQDLCMACGNAARSWAVNKSLPAFDPIRDLCEYAGQMIQSGFSPQEEHGRHLMEMAGKLRDWESDIKRGLEGK